MTVDIIPIRPCRTVKLGDGKRVPLAVYVQWWRTARTLHPLAPVDIDLCHPFTYRSESTARMLVGQFRKGMQDRMSVRAPDPRDQYRKCGSIPQIEMMRLAQKLRDRIVIRPGDVPKDLRKRLAHRITWPHEE
jgi:hypothetical protein